MPPGEDLARTGIGFVPLVASTRGGPDRMETLHLGAISVVNGAGEAVLSLGDTERAFPLRSTSKPFQLLPFLLDGLDAELEPDEADADLAVMMASHTGTPAHTTRVAALLARFGLEESQLLCGAHPPFDAASRVRMVRAGETPTALHSNCSGKHTAMLAVCARRGWPTDSYVAPDHPLQIRIRAIIAGLTGEPEDRVAHSIDGCSLPTWWIPTRGLALGFARLAGAGDAPRVEGRDARVALERVYASGSANPEMISGPGRFDTSLMRALSGAAFVKGGAAGLVAAAVAPSGMHPQGLGIAIKILDGDPEGRVRGIAMLETLRSLGVAGDELTAIDDGALVNVAGTVVGAYRAVF